MPSRSSSLPGDPPINKTRHSLKGLPLTAIALAVATTTSPSALAQDGAFALEEVIVTARKRSESIQNVPISVTSIGKELSEASFRRLDDLQSFSPNVYLRRTPGVPGGAAISIRGVSYAETDKSYDPSIGVIMEGMYMGTASGSLLQNYDIKRIEVLRGPQGTLFGKNTTGGVINVIRGDVTMDWGGSVSATLGNDGRTDVQGVLNVPIIEGQLGVKLFANSFQSDGYIRNTTFNDDVLGDDYTNYGFATRWEPSEDFNLQFHYERNIDKTDTAAWANVNQPGERLCGGEGTVWPISCETSDTGSDKDHNSTNQPNENDSETDNFILTANYDTGPFLLTSITAYRDVDEHNFSEFDASPADFLFIDYFNEWEQFSQEFRITSQFSDTFEFVGGLYYWDVDYSQRWDVGELWYSLERIFGGTGGQINPNWTEDSVRHSGQDQETESLAVFFSGDWHINEQWTATAGLRWIKEEKDFRGSDGAFYTSGPGNSYYDGAPRPDLAFTEFDDDWSEITPKLGLRYQHNDDLMVFASYTEGFKSGGFFGRQASFTSGVSPSYDPEFVETYELGMKSTWLDGRLIFNPTVFYSDYSDKQESILVAVSDTNVATVVRNAATQTIFGLEMELQFQVTEKWNVRATYGYVDAEFDEYDADLNSDGIITDNSNLISRNTPENTWSISSTYTVPVGNGDLQAFAAYRWRDEVESIANNDPLGSQDSVDNLGVNVSYTFGENSNYRVSAFGRNITDERERIVQRINGLTTRGQWTEGRTYGVEVGMTF